MRYREEEDRGGDTRAEARCLRMHFAFGTMQISCIIKNKIYLKYQPLKMETKLQQVNLTACQVGAEPRTLVA